MKLLSTWIGIGYASEYGSESWIGIGYASEYVSPNEGVCGTFPCQIISTLNTVSLT